ncbi:MAG TPA: hypothetical protein VLR26_11220 [Frankiaceae bacterium]|nr:hypothetical protein [Frankiaceae bacterium]
MPGAVLAPFDLEHPGGGEFAEGAVDGVDRLPEPTAQQRPAKVSRIPPRFSYGAPPSAASAAGRYRRPRSQFASSRHGTTRFLAEFLTATGRRMLLRLSGG